MTFDQEEDLFNCFMSVVAIVMGCFFLYLAYITWDVFLKSVIAVVLILLTLAIPIYVCYRVKQWRKK